MHFVPNLGFINLFNSTIMNLGDLPVFRTTGEVARCTKFLINRIHDKILWLDQRYPVHVDDIHQLTDYLSRVRMSPKDSKARESMGKRKARLAYMRIYTHREVAEQQGLTQLFQKQL
jgi:hypothetical protein